MRKEYKILSLLFLSLFMGLQCAYNQEGVSTEQVLLHGVVLDAVTQMPIPNVHYIISKNSGGVTNEEGKFSMYINHLDTIVFSFLGYSDFVFSLSDTLTGRSFVAGIFLQTDTLALGEVIVLPRMSDLKTEFRNTNAQVSQEIINAQNNLEVATYQGLNNNARLGDPSMNYELLKRKQVIDAYEKGGIPSDKMVGLNIISLIPLSVYLLKNGLPEKPPPPAPHVSDRELKRMIDQYRQNMREEKKE